MSMIMEKKGIKRPLDEEDVDVVGIKQPFSLEEDLDVMIVPDPAGSPPELEEEEEEDMAAKRRKRNRSVFSVNQLKQLEDSFKANPYPDKLMRDSLAAELDMTEKKVNNWFQNRRVKLKKHNHSTTTVPATPIAAVNVTSRLSTGTMVTPAIQPLPFAGLSPQPQTAFSPLPFFSHSGWPYPPTPTTPVTPLNYYANVNGSFLSPTFVPAVTMATAPGIPYQFFAPATPTNNAAFPIMDLTPPPTMTLASPLNGTHFNYSY